MAAAKNVYALMLALVIVLSGCFGNTADDTGAQTSDDTGLEMIAIGGTVSQNSSLPSTQMAPTGTNIVSSAGELVQIHEAKTTLGEWGKAPSIYTTCNNGEQFTTQPSDLGGNSYATLPLYLPGAFSECTHVISIYQYENSDNHWSLVYSVSTTI